MAVIDLIAVLALWILGLTHYPMNFWVFDAASATIVANIVALWRDGVS